MPDYGTIKQTTLIEVIAEGKVTTNYVSYHDRIKVANEMEQTSLELKFWQDINTLRKSGKLYLQEKKSDTFPSFTVIFPSNDKDGSYFVEMRWCEKA